MAIVVERGTLGLDKCKFEHNQWHYPVLQGKYNGGGAVLVGPNALLNLTSGFARREGFLIGTEFSKNTADRGGALTNYGRVTFDGARFEENFATNAGGGGGGGKGGAIYSQGGMYTVENPGTVKIHDNKAMVGGSAVWLETPTTEGMPLPPVVATFDRFEIRANTGQAVVVVGATLNLDRSDLTLNTGVGVTLLSDVKFPKATVTANKTTFDRNDGGTGPTSLAVNIVDPNSLFYSSDCDFKNSNTVNVPRIMGVFDVSGKGWVDDFTHPSKGIP